MAGRADAAPRRGTLAGWVNNAASSATPRWTTTPARELLALIVRTSPPPSTGAGAAVGASSRTARRGAIVNVSSHQAQRAVRGALPYATAKAAIEGLTRALAVDHGPRGIRINAVALGSIGTKFGYDATSDTGRSARLHPLGRAGQAAEVAEVVAHLLSPAASFVNGAVSRSTAAAPRSASTPRRARSIWTRRAAARGRPRSFHAPTEARTYGVPGRLRTLIPASASRSRVAPRSSSSHATSVVSPRGATGGRAAEPLGESGGQLGPRASTAPSPAARRTSSAARLKRDDLARRATGVS